MFFIHAKNLQLFKNITKNHYQVHTKKHNFLISQPKHIDMGTQKNPLNESTQNIMIRKYLQFYAQKYCLNKPMHYFGNQSLRNGERGGGGGGQERTFVGNSSWKV